MGEVRITHQLVDGGLASNLPISLFDRESRDSGHNIIAFDLVQEVAPHEGAYGIGRMLSDMYATALSTGDTMAQLLMAGNALLTHVKVIIPPDINTFDIHISAVDAKRLFDAGVECTRLALGDAPTTVEQLLDRDGAPSGGTVAKIRLVEGFSNGPRRIGATGNCPCLQHGRRHRPRPGLADRRRRRWCRLDQPCRQGIQPAGGHNWIKQSSTSADSAGPPRDDQLPREAFRRVWCNLDAGRHPNHRFVNGTRRHWLV